MNLFEREAGCGVGVESLKRRNEAQRQRQEDGGKRQPLHRLTASTAAFRRLQRRASRWLPERWPCCVRRNL